jgi:hypothetical protein
MGADLHLEIGNRYTVALVVFFPPYFLFEVRDILREAGSVCADRAAVAVEYRSPPRWKCQLAVIHSLRMGLHYDRPGKTFPG